jgi:signal transduction histidine kinase
MSAASAQPSIQKPNHRSLRFYLLRWFVVLVIIIGILAALGVYKSTRKEALKLQDHYLELIALLITNHHSGLMPDYTVVPASSLVDLIAPPQSNFVRPERKTTELEEAQIVVQQLDLHPTVVEPHWIQVPNDLPEGLSTLVSNDIEWRIFVRTLPDHQRFLVGQRTAVRNELAAYTSMRMLIPFVVLIPTLFMVITLVIRRAFKPITRLAAQIDRQKDDIPLPISDTNIPREILPFVQSINQLLARLNKSLAQQRRFVADAAHELRTPITALTLQSQNLEQSALTPDGMARVAQLRLGLGRAQRLLEQLLSLARQQSGSSGSVSPVLVKDCLHEVLVDMIHLATSKEIDLGVLEQVDVRVMADGADIQTLLRNAISNAIRFTPRHGRVDIRIKAEAGCAVILVEDSGAGIPESEIGRVFDPFYRVLGQNETGSGLGLTIIQEIATHYHASVSLRNLSPHGLQFRYAMAQALV